MIKAVGKISSYELLKLLLVKHNILIKDISHKTDGKNYLRIAIRDPQDNDLLISILHKELC